MKKLTKKVEVGQEEDGLITAQYLTEKKYMKLLDKQTALKEEIEATYLTLELINEKMNELGITKEAKEETEE